MVALGRVRFPPPMIPTLTPGMAWAVGASRASRAIQIAEKLRDDFMKILL
jgi:hypothetical protein